MRFARFASIFAIATALSPCTGAFARESAPATTTTTVSAAAVQATNVLVWMLDDVGYAQLSSFGSLIDTPNIDRVAWQGLRYANYHTAPICSASRAAFLTVRNPHSVHVGGHAAAALPLPGHDSEIPPDSGTVAAYLRQAGYDTFALGKWDHLPRAHQSAFGPYRLWPLGQGFDRFYGFLAADTDNWAPTLIQDNAPAPTPGGRGYHLNIDLADKAIDMITGR